MIRKNSLLVLGLLGIAAWGLIPATASGQPAYELALRQDCQGNSGTVPGTNGIYSLRTRKTSCRNARRVVRKFHTKRAGSSDNTIMARGYSCQARYTEGYEGLTVSCRRSSRRVKWTAYLDPSVRTSSAFRARSCGQVVGYYPDVEGGSGVRITKVANIGCHKARKVMKKCIKRWNLPGWRRGGSSSSGSILRRGNRKIWYVGTAGGAPHCTSSRP